MPPLAVVIYAIHFNFDVQVGRLGRSYFLISFTIIKHLSDVIKSLTQYIHLSFEVNDKSRI